VSEKKKLINITCRTNNHYNKLQLKNLSHECCQVSKVPEAGKMKQGITSIHVSHLYQWSIIVSEQKAGHITASVPLQEDFQNSNVLNDSIKLGLLTCQTFKNSHFHFLFFVESFALKVSHYS
jgi:hypothetical protein